MDQQEMTLKSVISNLSDSANKESIPYHAFVEGFFNKIYKVNYDGSRIYDGELSDQNLKALLNDAYNRGKRSISLSLIKDLINSNVELENYNWDTSSEIEEVEDLFPEVKDSIESLNREELKILTEKWDLHSKTCLEKRQQFVRVSISSHSSSGLGIVTIAKCDCGFEMDVTDYGAW
jgi:hypothetical protein